jgi:hypothetical protein
MAFRTFVQLLNGREWTAVGEYTIRMQDFCWGFSTQSALWQRSAFIDLSATS